MELTTIFLSLKVGPVCFNCHEKLKKIAAISKKTTFYLKNKNFNVMYFFLVLNSVSYSYIINKLLHIYNYSFFITHNGQQMQCFKRLLSCDMTDYQEVSQYISVRRVTN